MAAPHRLALACGLAFVCGIALPRVPSVAAAPRVVAHAAPQDPDSAAAVDRAREAQARFERRRLRHVDVDRSGSWGSGCDETVGRICLHLDEAGDWWPGEEDPDLVVARDRLLEELAEAAREAPGDAWLLGQRVVYLGEAGRWDDGLTLARRCGVLEPGWCDALAGVALHASGRFVEAAAAFERALDASPPERAREWRDVEPLLDGDGRDRLDDLTPDEVEAEVSRFWRLSDPLYLVPGNDRRTEHLARRVVAHTRSDARNAYAMSWGSDLDDVLVRYGWEVGWERMETRPGDLRIGGSGIGQHHPYTRGFVALGDAWRDPAGSREEDWNPAGRRRPRTGYAPRYAPVFLPAPGAVSVLPRGDRVAVVAVAGLPEDTTYHSRHDHPPLPVPGPFQGMPDRMGLFLVPVDGDTIYGVTGPLDGGALVVEAPAGAYLLSLEAWSPATGRAGRLRRGVVAAPRPPDVAGISELMLARATPGDPEAVADLAPDILIDAVVAPGDTLRVAWEVYGFGRRTEGLTYRLSLIEDAGGFLRSAGRFLRLVGDPARIEIDWVEEAPREPGAHLRSVLLTVPGDADDGAYRIRLELASVGREPLVAERTLDVRAPDGARR